MKSTLRSTAIGITATLSLGLAACGDSGDGSGDASSGSAEIASDVRSDGEEEPAAANFTLSDGPDVCFREITKHLGDDANVAEVTSFFSSGSAIDSGARAPAGEMTTCTVNYQNPDDPRKLLSARLDLNSGKFGAPEPMEISVSGGDAAAFKLDDYVVPLSSVKAAALKSLMDAQKDKLDGVYGTYAWSGVRLEGPDAFNSKHTLRIDIDGRLASNDIKQNGYASVNTDGTAITKNHLMP